MRISSEAVEEGLCPSLLTFIFFFYFIEERGE